MINLTPGATSEVKRLWSERINQSWLCASAFAPADARVFRTCLVSTPREAEDQVQDVDGIKIVVEPKSVSYLEGMELDFQDGLQGKGFTFSNPNATKSCGCGESFSV